MLISLDNLVRLGDIRLGSLNGQNMHEAVPLTVSSQDSLVAAVVLDLDQPGPFSHRHGKFRSFHPSKATHAWSHRCAQMRFWITVRHLHIEQL